MYVSVCVCVCVYVCKSVCARERVCVYDKMCVCVCVCVKNVCENTYVCVCHVCTYGWKYVVCGSSVCERVNQCVSLNQCFASCVHIFCPIDILSVWWLQLEDSESKNSGCERLGSPVRFPNEAFVCSFLFTDAILLFVARANVRRSLGFYRVFIKNWRMQACLRQLPDCSFLVCKCVTL